MEVKGAVIILLTSFVTHWLLTLDMRNSIIVSLPYDSFVVTSSIVSGILLIYPLIGWIADVCINRYRAIKYSVTLMTLEMFLVLILLFIHGHTSVENKILGVVYSLLGMSFIFTFGFFEANVIQFGLDQLLGASSSQLSTFIHWYFWSAHVTSMISFYTLLSIVVYISSKSCQSVDVLGGPPMYALVGLAAMALLANSIILHVAGIKCMYIERTGYNPFHKIWKVLRYAWTNKYPQRRSAFTFWEEDIPSRIDLGKDKYGGPFSTEEVENVKAFLRLLLLIGSLVGFLIAGDGFSMSQFLAQHSCPSVIELILFVFNPLNLSSLVILVTIPILHCLPHWLCQYAPSMLKRIGIGLLLLLLQEIVYTALSFHTRNKSNMNHHVTLAESAPLNCYLLHHGYKDGENCTVINDPVNDSFLWLLAPQILHGLAQVLTNMTVLEFICAQAPRTMQGLLIGLWYAMFSIQYLLMGLLDVTFQTSHYYYVYQGVRALIVLVSLALYSLVAKNYKYRVREDVVPEQWLIENIIERRIEQEKRFWRRREQEQNDLDAVEQQPLLNHCQHRNNNY